MAERRRRLTGPERDPRELQREPLRWLLDSLASEERELEMAVRRLARVQEADPDTTRLAHPWTMDSTNSAPAPDFCAHEPPGMRSGAGNRGVAAASISPAREGEAVRWWLQRRRRWHERPLIRASRRLT